MSSSVAEAPESAAVVDETVAPPAVGSESPEPPDASPAPAGDEPASAGTEPTGSTRPRDPKTGRFIKSDGSLASDAEQAALEQTESAPASPASPPAPPTTVPPPEPFVFRADGQKIPVQGATLAADGTLTVPPEQVPALRQLLAEGVAHRGSWRQERQSYETKLREATEQGNRRADKYNAAAVRLWEVAEQLLADSPRELELLKREIGLELKAADLTLPKAPSTPPEASPAPAVDQEALERAAHAALTEEVEELLDGPLARTLYGAEDRKALVEEFRDIAPAFFGEVDNELVLDRHKLKGVFDRHLNARKKARDEKLALDKASQFNRQRNQPAPAAPPIVSPKGPASASGTPERPKSREEWRRRNGMM